MSQSILRTLEQLGRRVGLQRLGQRVYAIGIYAGDSPLALTPLEAAPNPVLTRASVTDAPAVFVADPFMLHAQDGWHMFFEAMVWRERRRVGVVCHATSADALAWRYDRIVLSEPFHLSYPYVFTWQSEHYMIPEARQSGAVRLYRADPFPHRWTHVADLLRGPVLLDSSLVRHDDRWWLFVETSPTLTHDTLRLFVADDLLGPWREHPRSPIVAGDRTSSRPGGRIVALPDGLVRFAQDCHPDYGRAVRAFQIRRLAPAEYEEVAWPGNPVLRAGGARWNRAGMHQIDAHPLPGGRWIAAVDGWYRTVMTPGDLVRLARELPGPAGEQPDALD